MPLAPLEIPERGFCRLWRNTRAIVLSTVGMALLLIFNGAQVASLLVLSFSRKTFRKFNRWVANTWWGLCVTGAERFNGTRILLSGDEIPMEENAIVVANHQQMPDITTIMALAKSRNRLGDLKFFVKDIIKWVPGIGWGMLFLDCVFVKRNWSSDGAHITKTFHKLVENRIPLWLVSFVEGTRARLSKIEASQQYARLKGLPELRHLLIPRTKGFAATVQGLRENISAVYDVTIGYEKGVPTLWQYIKGSVDRIHVHVRCFPIEEISLLDEEIREWLLDRWVEKDALLEHFYLHGTFPQDFGIPA